MDYFTIGREFLSALLDELEWLRGERDVLAQRLRIAADPDSAERDALKVRVVEQSAKIASWQESWNAEYLQWREATAEVSASLKAKLEQVREVAEHPERLEPGVIEMRRTDGRDAPGEKHDDCTYFVLGLTHDPFAPPAIRAYASACRESHPGLADGLDAWLQGDERRTYEAVRTPADEADQPTYEVSIDPKDMRRWNPNVILDEREFDEADRAETEG